MWDIVWSIAWNAIFMYNRALLSEGETLVASLNSETWIRREVASKLHDFITLMKTSNYFPL